MQESYGTRVRSLGWEDPLEEKMATKYSCLGNPIDRGAWWAIVCGVARLSDWTLSQYFITGPREATREAVWPVIRAAHTACFYFSRNIERLRFPHLLKWERPHDLLYTAKYEQEWARVFQWKQVGPCVWLIPPFSVCWQSQKPRLESPSVDIHYWGWWRKALYQQRLEK